MTSHLILFIGQAFNSI